MSESTVLISGAKLSTQSLQELVQNPAKRISIPETLLRKIKKQHEQLKAHAERGPVYGVNTGFGPLANRVLPAHQLVDLQYNLIRSHAAGAGRPIPQEFVRGAMIVRLNTLCKGNSAVSSELVEHLRACVQKNIVPVVYEHGAVGTSGDLIQLAHIALGLIGEGFVYGPRGTRIPAKKALAEARIAPYTLKPKEGLALINGTAMMASIGSQVIWHAQKLLDYALLNGGLALELVGAYTDSLDPLLHQLRPHPGQVGSAKQLREILRDSKLVRARSSIKVRVPTAEVLKLPEAIQQVYSLRCIPQILGPLQDTIAHAKQIVETELNAVTDNPIYDPARNRFLHGGNFHGDYIAVALDQLKIPLVKMGLLTERRINFFLNEHVNQHLPPFLNLHTPGLTLALQGLQFVATSTAAQCQTAAFPHTVHSIPTNGDNQDLVSMGTDAALLAYKVIEYSYILVAIEMTVLAQAVDYLQCHTKLASRTRDHYRSIRKVMGSIQEDRSLQPELEKLIVELKK